MNAQFMLLDDASELVIGHCQSITGLDGTIHADQGEEFHKLELRQLVVTDEFKEFMTKKKESMNRLIYICLLNHANEPIRQIPFFIFDDLYYSKLGFPNTSDIVVWRGSLESILSQEQMDIYPDWIQARPTGKNQWAPLSTVHRRAWLRIVKTGNLNHRSPHADIENHFIMDGTHITDYAAFFCALGEAINGPGGYYGSDLASMTDCCYGGFGTEGAFTLIWENHDVAKMSLDEKCWLEEMKYRQLEDERSLSEATLHEVAEGSLFECILEVMKKNSIHVILRSKP